MLPGRRTLIDLEPGRADLEDRLKKGERGCIGPQRESPHILATKDLATTDTARPQPILELLCRAAHVRWRTAWSMWQSWAGGWSEEMYKDSWPKLSDWQGKLRANSTPGSSKLEHRNHTEPPQANPNSTSPCKGHRQWEPKNKV